MLPGSVAGGVDDLRFETGNAGGRSILGALVKRHRLRGGYAQPASLHLQHAGKGQIRLMEENGCAGDTFELRGAPNVVDMRMCDDDLPQREVVPRQPREDVGDLVAGVDNNRFSRLQIRQQSAVAAQGADGEGFAKYAGRHLWIVARRISNVRSR
jgi:hypothetical protein